MTILAWIIRCDKCNKIIDGRSEEYFSEEYGDREYCRKCFEELEDENKEILWLALGGES